MVHGMLSSIFADGQLHIINVHVLTGAVEFSQRVQRSREPLVVHAIVAVGRTAVALGGEGLLDSMQMILQVHLDEFEDSLALLGLGGVVSACNVMAWRNRGVCFAECVRRCRQ